MCALKPTVCTVGGLGQLHGPMPETTIIKAVHSYWHLRVAAPAAYGGALYSTWWLPWSRYQVIKQRIGTDAHLLIVDTQIAREVMIHIANARGDDPCGDNTPVATPPIPPLDGCVIQMLRDHNRTTTAAIMAAALCAIGGSLMLCCSGIALACDTYSGDTTAAGLVLWAIASVIMTFRRRHIRVPGCATGELPPPRAPDYGAYCDHLVPAQKEGPPRT